MQRSAQSADGATQREHLLQVCEQLGKTPEEMGLEIPEEGEEVPEGGEFLWQIFWELSLARGNNGFSENPLSWQEIREYAALNSLDLGPYDAATLRGMDHAYLTTRAEMAAKTTKKRRS